MDAEKKIRIIDSTLFIIVLISFALVGYVIGAGSNPFANPALKHANFYYLYSPNASASNALIPNESFIVNQSVIVKCFRFSASGHSPINCTKAQSIVNATLPNGMIYTQLQNVSHFSLINKWSP